MTTVKTDHPERTQPDSRNLPSCTFCPVCGLDECLVLQDLGMYCETMAAAYGASAGLSAPGGAATEAA